MFMSHEDLTKLTGYKLGKCQIKWLRENGIYPLVGADGKPKVLISVVEQKMGALPGSSTRRRTEPNVDGLVKFQQRKVHAAA